jgi:hypothetical protein
MRIAGCGVKTSTVKNEKNIPKSAIISAELVAGRIPHFNTIVKIIE